MILDSEEQRNQLLNIIRSMPLNGPVSNVRKFLIETINPLELAVTNATISEAKSDKS